MARQGRPPHARLVDILNEIGRLREIIGILDYPTFIADWRSRYAIQHAMMIISEAVRFIPDTMRSAHPEVAWPQIQAFANLARHEYHRVDREIVWFIVKDHLDSLDTAVKALMRQQGL